MIAVRVWIPDDRAGTVVGVGTCSIDDGKSSPDETLDGVPIESDRKGRAFAATGPQDWL